MVRYEQEMPGREYYNFHAIAKWHIIINKFS